MCYSKTGSVIGSILNVIFDLFLGEKCNEIYYFTPYVSVLCLFKLIRVSWC